MKKFKVTIEEVVTEDFFVYANSEKEALEITEKNYYDQKLILSPGEVIHRQMKILDNSNNNDWVEF